MVITPLSGLSHERVGPVKAADTVGFTHHFQQLTALRWKVTIARKEHEFRLQRCSSDSQVWMIRETDPAKNTLLGVLVVYVDDFLLQTQLGPLRDLFLEAVGRIWTLAKEEILTPQHPITFLGIDIVMRPNGDYFLHQERFVNSLLDKYNLGKTKGNTCVQVDKVPAEPDIPTPAARKKP